MKRIGNIFERIWDIDNVRLAWSNHNANINPWKRKLINEQKVKELSVQLKDNIFDFGPYTKYKLFGGAYSKDRVLHIPTFYSAVAQRAIFNIIEPILDKSINTHSFCARKNFGGLKCAMKISRFVHTFKRKFCGRKNTRKKLYCLYFDIRKCYDNIHLETLYEIICGKIKDKNALSLIHKLIFSINTASNGFGLPIGNVGSHVFANLYLDSIYRRVSEIKKIKSVYVYMDNFTIFSSSKSCLHDALALAKDEADRLHLTIKADWQIFPTKSRAIKVCGFAISETGIRLYRGIFTRILRNIRSVERNMCISNCRSLVSRYGWMKHVGKEYLVHKVVRFKTVKRIANTIKPTVER